VGKLIPFLPGDASEDDLKLVAEGKMRLAEIHIDVDELGRIKSGSVDDSDGIEALLKDRDEGP
jgi:hypothetical protein